METYLRRPVRAYQPCISQVLSKRHTSRFEKTARTRVRVTDSTSLTFLGDLRAVTILMLTAPMVRLNHNDEAQPGH